MPEKTNAGERFEASRGRLRGAAYRMLGSVNEAEDAVQEAFLRFTRADTADVANVEGWLTTVVARICLDMLRSRKSQREEPLDPETSEQIATAAAGDDPEHETVMADSIGIALLVVLETLAPAERVAFVLHDMFDLPFDEIAPIVGRSPDAARQLASRGRRRIQGARANEAVDRERKRKVVAAFLAASRGGDFEALLSVLDPDVAFRADFAATKLGSHAEMRGARQVAEVYRGRAQSARMALIDGSLGLVVAIGGKLKVVLGIAVANDRIVAIEAIADPERLESFEITLLDA